MSAAMTPCGIRNLSKAVGLLKNGEYSAIIQVDDMFYILPACRQRARGELSLTDAYDAVKAAVVSKNADTAWIRSWKPAERHEHCDLLRGVYRDIGKN
jgi:hypothetical protein